MGNLVWWLSGLAWLLLCVHETSSFSSYEKKIYKNKVVEMFFHAYHSYMDHAYPADELMPLTCKGRVRGQDKSRGDIDDALGMFSLTLIDTLDTLAVLGYVDEFNSAIKTVVRDVSFDRDVVVSVFETNIRVLGGLLGAHFAAVALKEKGYRQLSWYDGHLLRKAKEVGQRLLPAFNTTTGLPYPKVNLRYGNSYSKDKTTCTACAGTMLLEFAALSRLTGDPQFEVKAHHAMEVLWQSRHLSHDLMGTVINVQNGEWTRKESGVGAGTDSYYEYCLKSYILLGDRTYLKRFQMHYTAIMKYISNGPLLVDVNMNTPTRMSRSYMDSLLAFWPGLQVLWGDVDAAIHTHDMLYHVAERHNFLPEAFTLDFRVHWGNHPLRPEFSESTYFLYKATGDPYYLDVGKTIVDNLNEFARVSCGFAAIKDLRNNEHEDRMDSFVLAETFKYLFLLFAEEDDVPLNMDDFVFTTEAHLFPLSLASLNSTLNRVVSDARKVYPSSTTPPPSQSPSGHMSNTPRRVATPPKGPASLSSPPPPSPSLMVKQLHCPNQRRPFVLQDEFLKLVLRQCTSSRYKIRPTRMPSKRSRPPRLDVNAIDFSSLEHLTILGEMGVVVEPLGQGRYQVSHVVQKAKTPEDAEEGWFLIQEIMKLNTDQNKKQDSLNKRTAKLVQVSYPLDFSWTGTEFKVGPALFGPDIGSTISDLSGDLYVLPGEGEGGGEGEDGGAWIGNGCQIVPKEEAEQCVEKIVMVSRGGCLFIQKVRNMEKAGAMAVIVADHTPYGEGNLKPTPFSMSGDNVEDVGIPSVFMRKDHALSLLSMQEEVGGVVVVKITDIHEEDKVAVEKEESVEDMKKEIALGGEEGVAKMAKHLQTLLEDIDTTSLTDELKDTVAKELDKIKTLNSEDRTINADSASSESEDRDDNSMEDLKKEEDGLTELDDTGPNTNRGTPGPQTQQTPQSDGD